MSSKKTTTLYNAAKANKKSKNDLIRAAVGVHMKQKNFVKVRKSDQSLLQNKNNFVFEKFLESDLRGGNCFTYSNVLCITNNQQMVDQQFGRFSLFVESQTGLVLTELRRLYGPMICHLYMELMKAKEQKAAADFLKKYAHLVAPVETYEAPLNTKINGCPLTDTNANDAGASAPRMHIKFVHDAAATDDSELEYFMQLIQILSTCSTLEMAECDENIMNFRSTKYEIHTTEAVVTALSKYLEVRGHVLILNLIYTWIHLHTINNEIPKFTEERLFMQSSDLEDDEEADSGACKTEEPISEQKNKTQALNDKSTPKKTIVEDPVQQSNSKVEPPPSVESEDMKKERVSLNTQLCLQTIHEVREHFLQAPLEYPCFIKIAGKSRGLTSAHIDHNECHFVGGFNDSTVQLWQINQKTYGGQNRSETLAQTTCKWETNNFCEDGNVVERDLKTHASQTNDSYRMQKFIAGKYESNSYNEFGGIQLRGHSLGVTGVRFSNYCPLLYSISKDCTMRAWHAESYNCAAIYRGHRYPIWCVDESPSGMYVATGSRDLTLRLWSLERNFPLITYAGHTQDVECIAFHPNGNYIASGSTDLSVRLWCVTSGKLMRIFSDCKLPITNIAFSPDGKMLAVGGEESKIRIFDLAAGFQINELKEHSGYVTSIAWSKSGQHLASTCYDGSLRLWDVKKLTPESNSSSTSNTTSSASYAASTNRLLTVNNSGQHLVKVYFNGHGNVCCIGSSN